MARRTAELRRQSAARVVVEQMVADALDLDAVAAELDRVRAVQPLARTMEVWGLSHADVARMFGVTRQAVAKWIAAGVPAERASAVADLAAATDLLVRHVQRDRIAAVVRRPAPALGQRSLVELAATDGAGAVLAACRAMFAFGQVEGS